MKPRVFVSSTYYDLKHVRERIERFFEKYSYEAVLFESNNVLFEHDKPLDISCYNEVKLCHMMVLIIGGRYGSGVSGDKQEVEDKKGIYNEYVSITRKEYETALKMKMPVFIFVDKNVHAEFQTFKNNSSFFDNPKAVVENDFRFAHVDDVNVFKFINSIRSRAIKTFDKIEDIELYLNSQLAGMMYLYLQLLQDESVEGKVLDSVTELQSISKQMNEMLGAVGRNLIKDDKLSDVLYKQNVILVDFFVNQFFDNINFQNEIDDFSDESTRKVYKVFSDTIFNYQHLKEMSDEKEWSQQWSKKVAIEKDMKDGLLKINPLLAVKNFDCYKIITNYYDKIYPSLKDDKRLKGLFDSKMLSELKTEIMGLPF